MTASSSIRGSRRCWPRPSRPDTVPVEKVSSGVDRLDTMLGGGLPAASTTLIMGPSGVGKTTLGLQFLSRCSEAEPGLLFGFYETPARIAPRRTRYAGRCGACSTAARSRCSGSRRPTACSTLYGERLLEAVRRRGRASGCSSTAWRVPERRQRAGAHGPFPDRADERAAGARGDDGLHAGGAGHHRADHPGADQATCPAWPRT